MNDCVGIWDINPLLHGKNIFGIPIAPPPERIDAAQYVDTQVLVTPIVPVVLDEITVFLISLGFGREQIITLQEILCPDCNYADFELFRGAYGEEEIFVDGGCLNFNSSMEFLRACPGAKKIYAFEPNLNSLDRIERIIRSSGFQNVCLVNAALWSENTILHFNQSITAGSSSVREDGDYQVNAVALDSMMELGENITFIKLDIEGSEMDALRGMRETISRCRPKLAICIYHKAYDYVDIPEYILSLVPEYKIYMRHYSDHPFESVMFSLI